MTGRRRILIVDDEAANRRLLADHVSRTGHEAVIAEGGDEALATLAREPIDLVLLDMMMPGTDGMAVLTELQKQRRTPALPVVVVTAHDVRELRIAALTAGATDFVTKPVDRTELSCRVRTLLELKDLRDRARADLAESDERFRSLATVAPVGIFRASTGGQVVYVNPRWCALAGTTPEEVAGHGCWPSVHPDDRARVLAGWQRYLEDQIPFRTECRLGRPDGRVTWVEVQAAELKDASGRIVGHVGVLVDITAQKQTEDALKTISASPDRRGSEDYFHVIVRQLANLVGTEFGFVGRLCGPERDRVQSVAFWADGAFAPDVSYDLDGTPCQDVIVRKQLCIHQSGVQERFPRDAMLADLAVTSYAGVPLFDTSGRALGLLGVLGTKPLANPEQVESMLRLHGVRAAAEMDRRRGEDRFANLFEFAPDAILMTDRNGIIRLMNRQAEQMFGWRREELLGQAVETLVPDAVREKHSALRDTFTQFSAPRSMGRAGSHLLGVRKDGTTFPVDISLAPMDSDEGPVVAAAVRDLTAHARAEKELRALEEQLRQSQRLDAIGRLAGGVAHDFNNQLTVILGHTELAREAPGCPKDVEESLTIIARTGRRAADLTRQLLAFSRKQVLRPCVLDVNASVVELETMCRRVLPENIALSVSLDAGTGKVLADPGQLQQVLMNLTVNARDAMPAGGELTIRTERLDGAVARSRGFEFEGAGDCVQIRVTDSGCGMDAETQARIFEPFFTTKPKDRGTGLGLSMVFGIVAQSNGRIEVHSEVGKGTTFTILLPCVEGGSFPCGQPAPLDPSPSDRLTILMVDDDADLREVTQRLLAAQGYRVLVADGPAAALRHAREHHQRIDLLLTDVILAEQNGADLACNLVELCPQMRVLFMSGHTDDILSRHGLADVGAVLLEKPFTRESLASKIRDILNGPSVWPARSRSTP